MVMWDRKHTGLGDSRCFWRGEGQELESSQEAAGVGVGGSYQQRGGGREEGTDWRYDLLTALLGTGDWGVNSQ